MTPDEALDIIHEYGGAVFKSDMGHKRYRPASTKQKA